MTDADSMIVFDRRLVRRHRDRAAPGLPRHDFLFREVAARLVDRLEDVTRAFPLALDLGCHGGEVARALERHPFPPGKGVGTLVSCDLSPVMAARAGAPALAADEELLPFAEASLDLVISSLSLHWVNDMPGALIQIRRALKPDGFFLAALLGGETLFELRRSLMEAELAVYGGVSPRVSPFAEVRDLGGLLLRAGFALPVVDTETITVTYANPLELMAELRGMGETNAVLARRRVPARRALIAETVRRYVELFAEPDGRVPATFQVLYATAWAPHESQPRPLRPGSARMRLADALGALEHPSGVKAGPPKADGETGSGS